MKKNRQNYEAPTLTVVEFRIERGFADSGNLAVGFRQSINSFVDENLTIAMGQQNVNNEPIGASMGNIDVTNPGGSSAWQYSNGGWF